MIYGNKANGKQKPIGEKKKEEIFEISGDLSESRNFTFGVGTIWVKNKSSILHWLTHGLELLILLQLCEVNQQVSKSKKLLDLHYERKTMKGRGKLSEKSSDQEVKKFWQILEKKGSQESIGGKLNILCEFLNENQEIHETICGLISELMEKNEEKGKDFHSLNKELQIKLRWREYPKRMTLNDHFECEFHFNELGEVFFKIEENEPTPEDVGITRKKIMRKSTIQSMEDESESNERTLGCSCSSRRQFHLSVHRQFSIRIIVTKEVKKERKYPKLEKPKLYFRNNSSHSLSNTRPISSINFNYMGPLTMNSTKLL